MVKFSAFIVFSKAFLICSFVSSTGAGFVTVTLHSAVFAPAFAVTVAVPSLTALTFPFKTVATASFELVQLTVLSVAFSGFTVAVSVPSPPSSSVISVLFKVTEAIQCFRLRTPQR